jgi:hypothetical protein
MGKRHRRRAYGILSGAGVLAAADPDDIGWTLPRRAVRGLGVPTRARLNLQFFPEGEWDLAAEPFEVHRYVRELFVDEVPVRESAQYRDMLARISDPQRAGSVWGCRTVEDVDRYFERLQAMFEDMRRHGYRPHLSLGANREDEVKVRVGRGGRLIKASGGNHRVSFAKILGIDRIPVLLCGVHKDYVRAFARQRGSWEAGTLVEALEATGLHVEHQGDVERVARRLRGRDLYHRTLDARGGLGIPAVASTYWNDASVFACGGGCLLGV